jgi:glycosyltransferase involved in cell wall biosynthesis
MIKISICIPVYNRENLIVRAIKSAQNQLYKNIEIVVVDNCSNDNTYSLIKDLAKFDPRIKHYQNSTNVGALKNFQRAIQYSTGDYIVLLGSDDWIEEDFASKKVEIINKNLGIPFVSGMVKIFNQVNDSIYLYSFYNYKSHAMNRDYINNNFYKKFLISYFCLFRRDLIANNFKFTYEDKYNWGVFDKGLGLDLINCLDIVNKSPNFMGYYASEGAYCFCNQDERESNEIIKSYETNNDVIKTIKDYKYNIYILSNHLLNYDKSASQNLIKFRNIYLLYELVRRIFRSEMYKKEVLVELMDYKDKLDIKFSLIFIQIMYFPIFLIAILTNKLYRLIVLRSYLFKKSFKA